MMLHPIAAAARRAAVIGLITFGAGCSVVAAPTPASTPSVPSLADTKRQVAEYVDSGRYAADIAETVTQARNYLTARLARGGTLAIVLDIDETALSNVPALRANDYGFIVGGPCADLPRGPCGFLAWITLARAEPIRPVLELARFARDKGVAVFFLTGRPERVRAATEANLKAAGYEWTAVLLKPDALNTASAVDFKASERKKLNEQGYVIVVNIGDQMSDLDGATPSGCTNCQIPSISSLDPGRPPLPDRSDLSLGADQSASLTGPNGTRYGRPGTRTPRSMI